MDTPKPRHIFMLSPVFAPEVGGIETHLMDFCKYLSARGGIRVTVGTYQPIFTLKRNDAPAREQIGCFDVHRYRWLRPGTFDKLYDRSPILAELYLAPYYFIRSVWLFIKHGRDADLIHSHGLMTSLTARVLSIVFRKPLVLSTHATYHLDKPSVTNRVMKWVFAGVNRVLVTSQHSREDVLYTGIAPDLIDLYRFWIDEALFHPEPKVEARQKLGWPERFTVLYAGRYLEVKGIKVILDTIPRLPSDVTLAFVGGGTLESEIRDVAAKHANVIVLPLQRNEDMRVVYSAADVVIAPSLWEEAFGRVLVEAMMCQTPVIVSRRGGMKELVTADMGLMLEPTEPDALLNAILELRADPIHCAALGVGARKRASEVFSIRNAETLVAAYERAIPR